MIAGERVRLKREAQLRTKYPELTQAVGVVSTVVREKGEALVHVRYGEPLNVVVLNAAAGQFETVDRLEPRLPAR